MGWKLNRGRSWCHSPPLGRFGLLRSSSKIYATFGVNGHIWKAWRAPFPRPYGLDRILRHILLVGRQQDPCLKLLIVCRGLSLVSVRKKDFLTDLIGFVWHRIQGDNIKAPLGGVGAQKAR